VLVAEKETAAVDQRLVIGGRRDPKLAANWVISELYGRLNRTGTPIEQSPVGAGALGELLDLIADGTITARTAKDVFDTMIETGRSAAAIVEEKGLKQITDTAAIEAAIAAVLDANPDKIADYRAGNEKLMGWFVGQVMRATGGKANPKLLNETLREKLKG
jgi:aspartyl-tRNA(Asn)/glutamyl-tRNA(Gln) amidotransferase subunit B